jgi:uncharacterized protein YndB with AHSA1/START domain
VTVIVNSVEIARPIEDVFDYLSDQSNELHWNPSVESMEKLTDGPVRVGTRYRAKWKGAPSIVTECTRYARPHGWSYRNGGPIAVAFDCDLEPTATGTRLVVRFDATPRGWFHLVFPLFLREIRKQERENMRCIKQVLEAHEPTPAGA